MKRSILILVVALAAFSSCRDRQLEPLDRAIKQPSQEQKVTPPAPPTQTPPPVVDSAKQSADSVAVEAKDSNATQPSVAQDKHVAPKEQVVVADEDQEPQLVLNKEKTIVLVGGLCLVFLLLICYVYFNLNRKIRRRNSGPEYHEYAKQLADLKSRMQQQIQNLTNQLNSVQNRQPAPLSPTPRFENAPVVSRPENYTLYFSAAKRLDNGYTGFDVSKAKSNFVPMESKYRLTIKADNAEAIVDIVADNFADMINMPQDYIEPVCQIQGQSTPATSRIVCLQSGRAKLDAGYWIVTQKMIVRYE